ncbi:hypothetical protein [Bordetella petrii]|uniref:Uncharacterized protein n=1 Tax=Bordetella petrii (strain ATCC BAA-461 / DSM 12804 / CCUG 43448 / CIP 107267 / Se-1111R) TaxID=340100 RepID=A9ID15_BORPD|nr:hypothetical protein [Bordetella petrii]CAP44746.1 hypothetical protein predicted by Glimmer/Critica [Bordetella petrii]
MPCYTGLTSSGDKFFLCGKLGPHCAAEKCGDVGTNLCDYPVGEGKTCDLPLCDSHAYEVAPNVHYCPGHLVLWQEFRASGRDQRELENVVPFKGR